MNTALVVFAKAPLPGYAKTRLVPALGEKGAAQLAERLLQHTLARALAADTGPVELCVAPSSRLECWQGLPDGIQLSEQGEGDLGARMARVAQRSIAATGRVILIGTDCPSLGVDQLQAAARALNSSDCVMVPAKDGGYVLLGLNRFSNELFTAIPWSTDRVAALTRERIATLGWSLQELAPLHDIDEPEDLIHLPDALTPRD
ncbi:TIGR04282 family arsenosugar biosynthesis glycosyltransferase [Marinobacterium sp. YM272]|uniref:TIGR04282 family arsenosugar biosynthesis glycosyltransferase n=1 Tax=Marinobacterium sp. YM272 TaxID=3421654 RepID=UPI003D7F6CFA